MSDSIHKRKSEHIKIVLNEKVTGDQITTGFERVRILVNPYAHQKLILKI